MKPSRIFLLLLLSAIFVANSQIGYAQTLPAKVKSYLDKNYSGWKQSVASDADCVADLKKLIVVGDFDGNGKQDYATRITHGRKGYFMAFLEQKGNYKPYILLSLSATQIKYYGMAKSEKGEEYVIGDPYDDNGTRRSRLPNDAPFIGDCGGEGSVYIYRNGRFSRE